MCDHEDMLMQLNSFRKQAGVGATNIHQLEKPSRNGVLGVRIRVNVVGTSGILVGLK